MNLFKKINRILSDRTYEGKLKYLRRAGAKIGEGTRLNCKISDFGTEPYLIEVGKDCLFASDIRMITHDGGVKVLNTLGYFDGKRMDKISPIKIGDNVYIGMGAYIMPGVSIGDNCIVAARAIVTKDIPAGSVVVGTPARVIKTIDEYYDGCIQKNCLYPTAHMSRAQKKCFFDELENGNEKSY